MHRFDPDPARRCGTSEAGATLVRVPTTRPRHTVTETDELSRALDRAAERWPADRRHRSRLLVRIVEDWSADHDDRAEAEADVERRLAAIRATAGAFGHFYPPGYLEELRQDWPE